MDSVQCSITDSQILKNPSPGFAWFWWIQYNVIKPTEAVPEGSINWLSHQKTHHCFMFNFLCFAPVHVCMHYAIVGFGWIQYSTSIVLNFCITHMYWIHQNPPVKSLWYFDGFVTDPICALRDFGGFGTAAIFGQQILWDFGGYGTVSSQND